MEARGTERAAVSAVVEEDEGLATAVRRLMAVTEASFEHRAQLERALKTRIIVEQAKGMLAERFRVRPVEAFELLRGAARTHQMRVHDLALEVVEHSDTPAAIITYVQQADEVAERLREGVT